MTYDEAKAIALATVTPRVGEVRIDGKTKSIMKVVGIEDGFVVVEDMNGPLTRWSERTGQWRRRVRNGRYHY